MKRKIFKNNIKILLISILSMAFLISCEKTDELSTDGMNADGGFSADMSSGIQQSDTDSENGCRKSMDPNFVWNEVEMIDDSGTTFPKTITLDYGDGQDRNGRILKGKIIVTITDSIGKIGAKRTIQFEDFSIDGKSISGSRTHTYMGPNNAGYPVVEIKETLTCVTPRGTITRSFEGTHTFHAGFTTKEREDNHIFTTGKGSIVLPDGKTMSMNIDKALERKGTYKHFLSGTETRETPHGSITIDFGDGTEDNIGTVTRDGVTETVNLDEIRMRRPGRRK